MIFIAFMPNIIETKGYNNKICNITKKLLEDK